MKFICEICGNELNLYKVKFVSENNKLICKKAVCCNKYMTQVKSGEYEGFPDIKRNDSALNTGDKLWNDFKHNNVE
ncbi:MAG: hypothetical protein CL525_13805 [Aequorivita sp.]|nr:hypothetical protein [Aequorivita sp.]